MKRKYKQIQIVDSEIQRIREEGKTRQEIADFSGLNKIKIKNWVNRYNHKQKLQQAGVLPRRRGRPPQGYKSTEQEKDNEIRRLKMEIELLRDFLQIVGRK